MSSWIDFKELRSKLKFGDVLAHYGVELKARDGEQRLGFCPLPSHEGKRNAPSFSAHLGRGIFQCFVCHAKGNMLDFAVLMDGGNPNLGRDVRKTALKLQAKFCQRDGEALPKVKSKVEEVAPAMAQLELQAVVNAPLDFELKGLDRSHPYLLGRGFTKETIAHFGLGYCERGSLAGRVAIPLHDTDGSLIGYAGRVVDDAAVCKENPRYRLPETRMRDGKTLKFRKQLFLYNGFRFSRAKTLRENLVVVGGFSSVWWLHQFGFQDVVATMGQECSKEQAELIVSCVAPSGTVWIIPDGGEEGLKFAQSLLWQISPHRGIQWVLLADGQQTTDWSQQQLKDRLTF